MVSFYRRQTSDCLCASYATKFWAITLWNQRSSKYNPDKIGKDLKCVQNWRNNMKRDPPCTACLFQRLKVTMMAWGYLISYDICIYLITTAKSGKPLNITEFIIDQTLYRSTYTTEVGHTWKLFLLFLYRYENFLLPDSELLLVQTEDLFYPLPIIDYFDVYFIDLY